MRRFFIMLSVLLTAGAAQAARAVYTNAFVNETGLAYGVTYDLDLVTNGIDAISMQAVYSAANIAAVTFTDGGVSTGSITVTSTNSLSSAFITINDVTLNQGVDWTATTTASGTAKAISDAIMANSSLSAIIRSTWTSGGIVYATATAVGLNAYKLYAYPPASLTRSKSTFTGGSASAIGTASSKINATAHGLTTALPVLYTKTAGTSPGQLSAGTTYYAIPIDANSFKLSDTSTGAVAGSPVISIATQTAAGGGSFTLTPTPIAGSYSFKWQESNDGTNFSDVAVSSVTYAASGNTIWDFGTVNFKWLRLKALTGTGGGLNLQVIGIGKQN